MSVAVVESLPFVPPLPFAPPLLGVSALAGGVAGPLGLEGGSQVSSLRTRNDSAEVSSAINSRIGAREAMSSSNLRTRHRSVPFGRRWKA